MPIPHSRLFKTAGLIGAVLIVVALLTAAMPLFGLPAIKELWRHKREESAAPEEARSPAERMPGDPDGLRLPPDVIKGLNVQTTEAKRTTQPRTLELSGVLALDTNHLARVHSRFAGEVARLEEVPDTLRADGQTEFRSLRPGDKVEKGDLLAVIWSKDLGEKKSELVDALSRLHFDGETLRRLREAAKGGAIPERSLRDAERTVEGDEIAADRAERTLLSWRLTEEEINAIKARAAHIRERRGKLDKEEEKDWAKVEVRAPFAGTIVEKNVAVGDIADTASDLFKIADLRTLVARVNVYEEDLRDLLALNPNQRSWAIHLKSEPDAPPIEGGIDFIGEIIDPNQHTALVTGRVPNKKGQLRTGQFITAIVELPAERDEVTIPTTAMIESGRDNIVFVQPDPAKPEYTQRRVVISRRLLDGVCVRSKLSPAEEQKGLCTVRRGEHVVSKGAVELNAALEDLKASAQAEK